MINGIEKYFKTIQTKRATITMDSWNNPIQTYSNYSSVEGLIRQLSGKEVYSSNSTTPVYTHRMYCRIIDIIESDHVVYDGVEYEVVSINNVMNFDELLQVELNYVKL